MSNKKSPDIIDASEITDKSAGLDLFFQCVRNSLSSQFNAIGKDKTVYSMVALTPPIKVNDSFASVLSNSSFLKESAYLFQKITDRSKGKFMFYARCDEPNSPHSFLPNPCTMATTADIETTAKLISLHTLVISTEASAVQSTISAGDVVLVRLRNGNIQSGELVGLDTPAPIPATAKACEDLASALSPSAKYIFASRAVSTLGDFSTNGK
jgi:hypothetical protein